MVTLKMKKYGRLVEVLDASEYEKLEGLLRENLPKHVPIEIEREEKEGKIELWSRYPIVMKKALQKTREMHKKYGTDAMSKVREKTETKVEKEEPKKKEVVSKKQVAKKPKQKEVVSKRQVAKKPKKKKEAKKKTKK